MASANDERTAAGPPPDAAPSVTEPDDGIATLQEILIGPARRRLDSLEARLDDPEARAVDVGEVLPRVLADHAHDPALARALAGPLEDAITASVRRNPAPLSDALFPVMGPAIRKAVSASLASMIESLNRTLEHAVSWRSVQWRLEALRTHRSFAEVVLLKTLLYRVEQVFLIDRRSGLLILHVQAGSAAVADADMVSGMLTAIRDFVGDSFHVGQGESLEALKVGDLSVRIEPGPRAMLAAVVRGTPPADIRARLQDAIETIHLQYGGILDAWTGDTAAFEDARPVLESCLAVEYRADPGRRPTRTVWILVTAALVLFSLWGGLRFRDGARHARYLEALSAEPGLAVISADRRGRRLVLRGLRDPLARNPADLVAGTGLDPGDLDARWTPYQSLDAPLVLARARDLLRPAAGTSLEFADGVLRVGGTPDAAWLADATRLAPVIGGVSRVAVDAPVVDAVVSRVESSVLLFAVGSAQFVAGQDDGRTRLLTSLAGLDALARATGARYLVTLVGHTDAEGTEAANLRLSQQRAEAVRQLLPLATLASLEVTTAGVGSREPASGDGDAASRQRNRRVTIRVSSR